MGPVDASGIFSEQQGSARVGWGRTCRKCRPLRERHACRASLSRRMQAQKYQEDIKSLSTAEITSCTRITGVAFRNYFCAALSERPASSSESNTRYTCGNVAKEKQSAPFTAAPVRGGVRAERKVRQKWSCGGCPDEKALAGDSCGCRKRLGRLDPPRSPSSNAEEVRRERIGSSLGLKVIPRQPS